MKNDVKLKVHATPSEQLTKEVRKDASVTDANGRVIVLKKPNVLAQFRLVKMLGDAARNPAYMSMVTPLTYIVSIDGEGVPPPNTERELDALIQRLDDEGVLAILEGLQAHFGNPIESDQAQELKNS